MASSPFKILQNQKSVSECQIKTADSPSHDDCEPRYTPSPKRNFRSLTQLKLKMVVPTLIQFNSANNKADSEKLDSELVPSHMLVDSFAREFKLIESIGKGNQAEVFKAQHKHSQEVFAAKIYNTREEERIMMIKKEADILKLLNKEEIIKFVGFEEDHRLGNFVILTEFFDGAGLDTFLSKNSTHTLPNEHLLLSQILTSLLYLHENSITHGDFNIKNILLSSSDPTRIKIIDFGLAKQIDFKSSSEDLLTPQGNQKYRAPKHDAFQNSFACDLWGFGLVALSVLQRKKISTKKALKMVDEAEFGENYGNEIKGLLGILKRLIEAKDYVDIRDVALGMRKIF